MAAHGGGDVLGLAASVAFAVELVFEFADAVFEPGDAVAQGGELGGVRGFAGGKCGELVGAVRPVGGHEPVVGGEQVVHDDHERSGNAKLGRQGGVHVPPSEVQGDSLW
ncbi:hypothetical protein [Lentzea sp. HUAS12]|uniref:hypothetical protein n=1 Tax=Lentzea sp. HUAS12 TaxID=2951806 RepID=UPI0020A17BDE|nr:hypothetical protein [Lentzea sp. HUAS12]USX56342.1 hypothetical protein ND450_20245 [Lentzea sp. HUAS12]